MIFWGGRGPELLWYPKIKVEACGGRWEMLLSRTSPGLRGGQPRCNVLQGSSRTHSSLKRLLKPPGSPPDAVNIWKGGAEPGLSQFCSTPLHENAKALDDAPFSGDGAGGWGLLEKTNENWFLQYRNPSSACPRCPCGRSEPRAALPCRVDTPLHPHHGPPYSQALPKAGWIPAGRISDLHSTANGPDPVCVARLLAGDFPRTTASFPRNSPCSRLSYSKGQSRPL